MRDELRTILREEVRTAVREEMIEFRRELKAFEPKDGKAAYVT